MAAKRLSLGMLKIVRNLRYLLFSLLMVAALTGCSRTTTPVSAEVHRATPQQLRQTDEARQQMELIPPPSKTRYMAVKSLTSWENPYVTVQGAMLTLHVLLADANTSGLGEGGLLRPVGARRQDLNIRVSDLPTALNAVPESAWPYGRVVAVEEAHNVPVNARPEVRRNVETTMQMLSDLGVVVYEWNEGGAGLR
jgi:hypothetical protein